MIINQDLRCYTFTLYQLSSIQQGIQAGHAAIELVATHPNNGYVRNWALNHKTLILLNGGDCHDLDAIALHLNSMSNPYPYAFFKEDGSFGGLFTSIAIILPMTLYMSAESWRKSGQIPDPMNHSTWDVGMMEILNRCSLAR